MQFYFLFSPCEGTSWMPYSSWLVPFGRKCRWENLVPTAVQCRTMANNVEQCQTVSDYHQGLGLLEKIGGGGGSCVTTV